MLNDSLKNQIANITKSSGVYKFMGEKDEILYIGKAKSLQKRLLNYCDEKRLCARIKYMTSMARSLEVTQTSSDLDALLLEHNLIKKLEPKFNILLRDDKSFPMIAIDKKHDFASIVKHRGLKNKDHYYFGPFASGLDVNRVIDILKKSFLIRSCSDQEFKGRKKPCLEYQIKRCSAPCVGLVARSEYNKSIHMALDFLSGKSSEIQNELAKKMQIFSDQENFEKAAVIRDQIKSLSSIQAKQNINFGEVIDADVITLVETHNQYCIYISFYRKGNNYGAKPYFYKAQDELTKEEFLANFLGQFYLNQEPPQIVMLNLEIAETQLMEDFLSKLTEQKTQIKTPKLGDKLALIKDQEVIAKKLLEEKINQNLDDEKNLLELKNLFGLEKIPQRIEVYDNSHTGNQNAVGALICAGPGGFIKSGYRKYNIKFEGENRDDTAMMKEVLTRRFGKKTDEQTLANPDFIIIDGGLPQLSATQEIFDKFDIKIPFVCMSKGPNRNAGEEFFHQTNKESFTLPKNNPLMYYLQRLRDEAHRFVITAHRGKRAKGVTKSALDEIKGVGAKRKKLLLNHFGSVDKIKAASMEDLMRVEGINKSTAEIVFNSLK